MKRQKISKTFGPLVLLVPYEINYELDHDRSQIHEGGMREPSSLITAPAEVPKIQRRWSIAT
jgi:hypothetical protein